MFGNRTVNVCLLALVALLWPAWSQPEPATGQSVPSLAPFDRAVQEMMRRYRVPGAALAVAREGRLVYVRGFGYADRDARVPVAPASKFRIASISKPITAAALLKLVEERHLSLSSKAF